MITDREIAASKARANKTKREVRLSESLGRGSGSLLLKATPGGAHWYYRYAVDRKSTYVPIGPHGDHWTLKRARDKAKALSVERGTLSDGDLRAYHARQEADELARIEAQRLADELARRQIESAQRHTLRALVDVYVKYLKDRGKKSAREAHNILYRHVIAAWPELASGPAYSLTRLQVTGILRRIIEAGNGRTAGKVRSYLSAAYALALRAEGDPDAPAALLSFGIDHNPVANTASLSRYNNARDRVLRDSELHAYWARLLAQESIFIDIAKVQILTAGQRFEQLLRAQVVDFNKSSRVLTLRDPKGRRSTPRLHMVPLPHQAIEIMQRLADRADALNSTWLFTSEGKTPVHASTMSKFIADIADAMLENNEVTASFMPSDLRRSVETMLASMGISRDTRAQIQSHGISGVQARHYDRHDYLDEKRAAIESWAAWLMDNHPRGVRI